MVRRLRSGLVAAAVSWRWCSSVGPCNGRISNTATPGAGCRPMTDVAAYFRRRSGTPASSCSAGSSRIRCSGSMLSNRVRLGSDPPPHPGPDACRWWRTALGDRYDYIVLTDLGFGLFIRPPEDVIARDRAAEEVLSHGHSAIYTRARPPASR